jgi:hypothetical protein
MHATEQRGRSDKSSPFACDERFKATGCRMPHPAHPSGALGLDVGLITPEPPMPIAPHSLIRLLRSQSTRARLAMTGAP